MSKRVKGLKSGIAVLSAFVLAPVFFGSGCSDKPSCKLLYQRLDKCEDDFALKEDKFLKMCEKRKDKTRVKEQIKCSKHSDCKKFKKCLDESGKKARAADTAERIEKAIKEKDYSKAMMACKYNKEILTDELKKKCDEVAKTAYKEIHAKAVKMRDEGPIGTERFRVCSDLKSAAKALGEEKEKEAKKICEELNIAEQGQKAIEKAKEALKEGKSIPFNCDYSLKKITAAKGDFAEKLKKEVIQACYVDLGAAVLEKEVPKMKRFCPYKVKQIFKAVKKYDIKDPKLDPLLEKAKPLCDK